MIDKLNDACCGCQVCGDICKHNAISFKFNKEGFLFPYIDRDLCTECNVCELVCPMLNVPVGNDIKSSVASYAHTKPQNSSSGGMFSVLASSILSQGGVVYGAAFDETHYLRHMRITNIEDHNVLCGSKYVQSDCRGIYKQVKEDLSQNLKVLFVGTPCQVAGLRKFLRHDYDNIYLVDLVCHGVPSPGIFADYLNYCEKLRNKKIKHFQVRDNREGWNNVFKSTILFHDSEEYNSMLANLWNRIFFSELAIRKNCESCKFANQTRLGDITLGDFWGIQNANPLMYNKEGVSLLLINTKKGEKLFESVKLSLTYDIAHTVEKEHPNLYHSIKQDSRREEFMNDYHIKGFTFIVNKYFGYNRWLDYKIRLSNMLRKIIR